MTIQRELAKNLLTNVANELDELFAIKHYCNTSLARLAGDAAIALDFNDITPRFIRLLKNSRRVGFFGDVITNLRLPLFIPKRLRELTPLEEINEKYPLFPNNYAIDTFRKYSPEMLLCLENSFDSLLENASTEFAIEEIALSQAILGRYEDAIRTSRYLKDLYRKDEVLFVIAIEQYRNNHINEAQSTQHALLDRTLTGWGAAQFALGICNRVPWCPYPYPDY